MTAYRGVSQADLLSSINATLALLETHSPGPETQAYIDGLRQVDPATGVSKLGAIAAAQNDHGLVQALHASGAAWLFMRAHEVLSFHAVKNTDGKGLDVWKGLQSWGAMSGAMTMELNRYDIEFQAFMKKHAISNAFNKLVHSLPVVEGPMQYFAIEIPALSRGEISWQDPAVYALSAKVSTALEAFYSLDEVNKQAIGLINSRGGYKSGDPQGIVFTSTLRAAQAVADAVPDVKVVNVVTGAAVAPQAKPPSPKGPTL